MVFTLSRGVTEVSPSQVEGGRGIIWKEGREGDQGSRAPGLQGSGSTMRGYEFVPKTNLDEFVKMTG